MKRRGPSHEPWGTDPFKLTQWFPTGAFRQSWGDDWNIMVGRWALQGRIKGSWGPGAARIAGPLTPVN